MGHIKIARNHAMEKQIPPTCEACRTRFIIKHKLDLKTGNTFFF